ncbi:HK97 family phage prohead protease [uncultured Bosea sp.]|uniref:phage major capsid protein n=1 Tax=uncultured Bosea sp. TaxID=211457 RepID=UPI0025CC8CC1|nr:HK97 family phage prohead protease [uncultured Bosea sp.]
MNVALLTRAPDEMRTRLKAPDPRAIAAPSSYDAAARTVEAVVATDTPIKRFGVGEILVMSADAADLSRAAGGRMAFLLNHDPDRPIGTVAKVNLKNGQLVALLRFADTDEGRKAEGQVARGELSQFSIGFRVNSWNQRHSNSATDTIRAVDWELYEISLVAIPADKAAVVRSLKGTRMPPEDDETLTLESQPESNTAASATARRAERAERSRVSTLADLGRRAGLEQIQIDEAVENGTTVDAFRIVVNEALVARQSPSFSAVRVERDEGESRVRDMALEIRRALAGGEAPLAPSAARYRGLPIVEMAAEVLGHRGRIPHDVAGREEILRRAFHATSDFPLMFETATGGHMAARYASALPTYRQLCRRRDVSDFRPAPYYRPGDFPALQPVNPEGGEIKYGTFSESREYMAVSAYGIGISLSRAMLVNDQLGAIADVLNHSVGNVVAFEDRLFWTLVLSSAGAGPQLQATGRGVFNTTDGSLAGTAAAVASSSVSLGRAAMRKRKSLDGLFVQSEPKFIVGGPDKETEIDQLLASITPESAASANPFAGAFEKIISPEIPGNAWYLFADPQKVPTFIYSLLDGYTAPRLTFETPFSAQGLRAKVEHDVGFSAVDFRGAYRNAGA